MCHRRKSRSGWFWPDHFFGVLMKFVHAYYSRTTSEFLPMPLYVSNLLPMEDLRFRVVPRMSNTCVINPKMSNTLIN